MAVAPPPAPWYRRVVALYDHWNGRMGGFLYYALMWVAVLLMTYMEAVLYMHLHHLHQ